MKITIGLFFGGKSTEHEVSVITGLQAFATIDKEKYDCIPIYITKENEFYTGDSIEKIEEYSDIPKLLQNSVPVTLKGRMLYEIKPKKIDLRKPLATLDVALPCVHGTNVEDGALQGFFETLRIPYAGCDVLSSAVGMDKTVQKSILKNDTTVPVLDCVQFTSKQFIERRDEITQKITFPCVVKPVNLGSSIGIGIADDEKSLLSSIENALLFSERVLVEPAVENLKEINCAVLGDKNEAEASECEEPVNSDGILNFDDKYQGGDKSGKSDGNSKGGSAGMASLKRKIPADITQAQRDEIRSMAVEAFKALGCSGVARIDFLINTETNKIYFNEINTIPGSLSFYLWDSIGIKYSQLLDKLIILALKREREKSNLSFSFESNILQGFKAGQGVKGGKL
jgi:D-alanine-D-alanine ligase